MPYSGGIFAEMAGKHSCPIEKCDEADVRFARVRRSAWGRLMHDVLFACHARLDVHKYDSALRRFTVAQTGTPSDWSQLEVGIIHVSCATNTLAHNILRKIQLCPDLNFPSFMYTYLI